ncbi:3-oxoacyl-[acyl-carrier protein] reductase [Neobacillus niacini]|jgi:3-oxoacyl-[acyl-carrier protein] reductase|uniref:SDR family NAD(P)-dependent oxidoreductase n=1 Tax=Neobacillus niacini TaxID=86668 RepID=UPI002784EA1B|nr:SDR family oxidoreductase [Neobacillus niacini]MDQ1002904.1 3-oxoacyl-[acyl-carrier protein] reductase [Neobacillus niacini]
MDLGLKEKVAIVTGGSKGIGFATALQLAQEGANIALVARNEDSLAAAAEEIHHKTGVRAFQVTGDMSIEADCQKVVLQTVDHFGRLDILVNNAGTHAGHHFEKVNSDLWKYDLDSKLFGAIHCSRNAIPFMRKIGGGAIVNITAAIAKTPPANSLPTTVSRAAGMALTKAMSKDLGPDNIRVNTVCIGLIKSDQMEKIWQKTSPHQTFEQFVHDPKHQIPLGRIGEAEEAAKVIAFLVSDAASYITGTSVNIDGGTAGTL